LITVLENKGKRRLER